MESSEPKTFVKKSESLIIPTSGIITEFRNKFGSDINDSDMQEIVSQILDVMITRWTIAKIDFAFLPDFKRLVNIEFNNNSEKANLLRQATFVLATSLYDLAVSLKMNKDNDFPYYFDRFLQSGDILLNRFPF
jgi:hypothetical protein